MGVTTTAGLPYPEPTDPIAAGANNIRALAEAVEIMVQAGTLSGAMTDASSDVSVTFPRAFGAAPNVVCVHGGVPSTGRIVHTRSSTTTTATFRCYSGVNGALTPPATSVNIVWIAVGKAPAVLLRSDDDEHQADELESDEP